MGALPKNLNLIIDVPAKRGLLSQWNIFCTSSLMDEMWTYSYFHHQLS